VPRSVFRLVPLAATAGLVALAACTHSTSAMSTGATPEQSNMSTGAPNPDPRVGLKAGLNDAGQALWNMKQVSFTPPSEQFVKGVNSDLAFSGHSVIQGNFNGFQVWDITDPSHPALTKGFYCPASQSDVSVYKNLLFVSSEGLEGRLDCAGGGVKDTVSTERVRGLRIFDIRHPESQVRRERADVPLIAHAHGAHRSEGPGRCVCLHLRLGAGAFV
ncbi:MAG: hypothetical protein ACREND_11190, partial [Gemmatimonadaceae bacterium]